MLRFWVPHFAQGLYFMFYNNCFYTSCFSCIKNKLYYQEAVFTRIIKNLKHFSYFASKWNSFQERTIQCARPVLSRGSKSVSCSVANRVTFVCFAFVTLEAGFPNCGSLQGRPKEKAAVVKQKEEKRKREKPWKTQKWRGVFKEDVAGSRWIHPENRSYLKENILDLLYWKQDDIFLVY